MIAAEALTRLYGQKAAVRDATFSVAEGETLALLGTSGSGKTTTLKMLNRIVEPTSGQVRFDGEDVSGLPAHELRRKMGYVIQKAGLFPHYTVFANVAVVPRLLGWEEGRVRRRVEMLLEKMGIPASEYGDKRPSQLSGGQQQRVGLARALAANPPAVLMDEPFGALDPVTRQGIRREFKELEEFRSKTVVLVTHDVEEAFELADRVCLMDEGRIVQQGAPAKLLFRPANGFVERFFDAQRLALQMRLVRLSEVWESLREEAPSQGRVAGLRASATVAEAAEALAERPALRVARDGEASRFATMRELMGAFAERIRQLSQP